MPPGRATTALTSPAAADADDVDGTGDADPDEDVDAAEDAAADPCL